MGFDSDKLHPDNLIKLKKTEKKATDDIMVEYFEANRNVFEEMALALLNESPENIPKIFAKLRKIEYMHFSGQEPITADDMLVTAMLKFKGQNLNTNMINNLLTFFRHSRFNSKSKANKLSAYKNILLNNDVEGDNHTTPFQLNEMAKRAENLYLKLRFLSSEQYNDFMVHYHEHTSDVGAIEFNKIYEYLISAEAIMNALKKEIPDRNFVMLAIKEGRNVTGDSASMEYQTILINNLKYIEEQFVQLTIPNSRRRKNVTMANALKDYNNTFDTWDKNQSYKEKTVERFDVILKAFVYLDNNKENLKFSSIPGKANDTQKLFKMLEKLKDLFMMVQDPKEYTKIFKKINIGEYKKGQAYSIEYSKDTLCKMYSPVINAAFEQFIYHLKILMDKSTITSYKEEDINKTNVLSCLTDVVAVKKNKALTFSGMQGSESPRSQSPTNSVHGSESSYDSTHSGSSVGSSKNTEENLRQKPFKKYR